MQWLPCPFTETYTVDDALEAIGFGKFQWKISLLTGLSWVRILKHPNVDVDILYLSYKLSAAVSVDRRRHGDDDP